MMTQENLPMRLGGNPNFTARSTTGVTLPRRLVTPLIHAGVLGTVVTVSYSMISRTLTMLMAYSSPAVKNVRYCVLLAGSCVFPGFVAPIISILKGFDCSAADGHVARILRIRKEKSSLLPRVFRQPVWGCVMRSWF